MQAAQTQTNPIPSDAAPPHAGRSNAGLVKAGKQSGGTAFSTEVNEAPSAADKSLMRIEAALLESGDKLPAGLEHAYAVNPGKKGLAELLGAETALRAKRDLEKAEKIKVSLVLTGRIH